MLLFLEPKSCSPFYKIDRYIVDGCETVTLGNEASIHIQFQDQVRFLLHKSDRCLSVSFEDDSTFALIEATVTSDVLLHSNSSVNEFFAPLFDDGRNLCGHMRFKLSSITTHHSITTRKMEWKKPVYIGHRGAGCNTYGAKLMENSLSSFNLAMDSTHGKLAGIELDVMMTADEKLVIYHDLHFPVKIRGQTRPVAIPTLRYADMCRRKLQRSLSNPDNTELFSSCIIEEDCPLLETVLKKLQPPSAGIVIEIKYPTNKTIRECPDLGKFSRSILVHRVIDCLKRNEDFVKQRWIALSSFDPDIVWMLGLALSHASPNILVLQNCWFGNEHESEDNTVDFSDARNRLPEAAIRQCRIFKGGIALEASFVLSDTFPEVDSLAKEIPIFSYGRENLNIEHIKRQDRTDAFFVDDIQLISNQVS